MPGMSWFQHAEFNQIEYNVSILNDVFATKIPEGYSSTNTKQSAFLNELFQNSNYIWYDQNDKKTSQKITSYACFTLNDGSVILGWSCTTGTTIGSTETDPESDIYQKEIFRELLVGSPLPKLPFVYYTVSPINEEPGIKYQGRHITYTLKNNVFHEWSIYVPDNKLDKYYGQLNYNLHYKSNREDVIKNGATTLGEIGDIRIENKNDFDTFVLGAMAELSEDGKAPEGVTYESVLQLTKQIRESMTQ